MRFTTLRSLCIAALITVAIVCCVIGGAGNRFDVALIRDGIAARAASPLPVEIGLFLNYAGGVAATLGLCVIGTLLVMRRSDGRKAMAFAGIIVVGRLLVEAIKLVVHRARPALDPHPVMSHSLSFPSAHAANSMISFTTFALFVVPPQRRGLALAIAVVSSLTIGASRSLIGVHWPSDVVAGWAIGAAWVAAWWPAAAGLSAHEAQHDIVGRHRPVLMEE